MSALRTHYVEISQHTDNSDGSLSVTAIARRSGIMRYRSDSGDRLEFVPPELIDARDDQGRPVMGMLAGAPNTNEHPAQVIRYSSDSRKAVQVGKVNEEIHIFNDADGERSVKVRFDVEDPETIADIRSGRKKGVSLGYLCNVIKEDGEYKGQPYTHKQAMPFTIDHLAIVANPRNPGALITRFDSDDVAVISMDTARSPIEVIRVDGCCDACSKSEDEDGEQKRKKKATKKDSGDSMDTVAINFPDDVVYASSDVVEALWAEGSVDRIRLDGEDFFASADLCLVMEDLGMIRFDEAHFDNETCGRGWLGFKGKCKRKPHEAGQVGGVLKKVGAGLVGAAAIALAVKNRRGIGRVAGEFAGQAKTAARSAGSSVGTAARSAGASVKTAAGEARTAVNNVVKRAGPTANRAVDRASMGVDRAAAASSVTARRAEQSLKNVAKGASAQAATTAAAAESAARRTAQSASNAAKGASVKGAAAATEAKSAATQFAGQAGKKAAQVSKAAQEAADRLAAKAGPAANKAARQAGQKAAQASAAAEDAIARLKKRFKKN